MFKQPKLGKLESGKPMHYSVGAVIKNTSTHKYLLIHHKVYGYAGVGGHVDEGESAQQAIAHEVKEEVGLDVKKTNLSLQYNSNNVGFRRNKRNATNNN